MFALRGGILFRGRRFVLLDLSDGNVCVRNRKHELREMPGGNGFKCDGSNFQRNLCGLRSGNEFRGRIGYLHGLPERLHGMFRKYLHVLRKRI